MNTWRERGSGGRLHPSPRPQARSAGPRGACFPGRRRRTAPARLQRGRPCRAGAAAAPAPGVRAPRSAPRLRHALQPRLPGIEASGPCAPRVLTKSLLRARPWAELVRAPAGPLPHLLSRTAPAGLSPGSQGRDAAGARQAAPRAPRAAPPQAWPRLPHRRHLSLLGSCRARGTLPAWSSATALRPANIGLPATRGGDEQSVHGWALTRPGPRPAPRPSEEPAALTAPGGAAQERARHRFPKPALRGPARRPSLQRDAGVHPEGDPVPPPSARPRGRRER